MGNKINGIQHENNDMVIGKALYELMKIFKEIDETKNKKKKHNK